MTCSKKHKYRNELEAKIALASTHRTNATYTREEKGYYWCQEHRGYHLTSQKGIRRK